MKLLFDANLSRALVTRLRDEYPGSTHVRDVGLRAAADAEIWDYAKAQGFLITSKDTDFRDRSFVEGAPPKVIWLDVGNAGTAEIVALLQREQPRLVFRGYVVRRVAEFLGGGRVGIMTGLALSSVYFGWAHEYQGAAGMVTAGSIGLVLGLLYVRTQSLTAAVLCHGFVDTAALLAIYFGRKSLLVPN